MGPNAPQRRACTLCRSTFTLEGPAMANPADLLCNACVLELWAAPEPDEVLEARCAERIDPERGIDPSAVASAILRRLHQLRDYARTPEELNQLLAARDPSWQPAEA